MARKTKPEADIVSPEQLDRLTSRDIGRMHVDAIWAAGDLGEMELLMQFLHLLHARRHSLSPDDVDTRRADFDEQMKLVFEGGP